MERQFTGTVIRTTGSWYDVRTDAGETVKCRIRGRLRLKGVRSTNPVVVGDRVVCERDEEDAGVICEVVPRRNYIIRRASNLSKESHIIAANLDRALLVVTLFSPVTAPEFIDRFLVTCEAYRVPVTILLAKADLAAQDPEAVAAFKATYESAGYSVLEFSAFDGTGIEAVRELLKGHTTCWPATPEWGNRPWPEPSSRGSTSARAISPKAIARAATPRPSRRCTPFRREAT